MFYIAKYYCKDLTNPVGESSTPTRKYNMLTVNTQIKKDKKVKNMLLPFSLRTRENDRAKCGGNAYGINNSKQGQPAWSVRQWKNAGKTDLLLPFSDNEGFAPDRDNFFRRHDCTGPYYRVYSETSQTKQI